MTVSDAVLEQIAARVEMESLSAYGIHVLVGDDEAERRWRSDDRENLYSVSKGVSALAAGIAIDEGILSLDTRAVDLLPAATVGEGVADVTLKHLLTMTSGIDFAWFADEPVLWPDLGAEMLARPRRGDGIFQYSDASTYLAMRMLGAVVGDVRDWLMPRLFDPLGIHNPQWHRCPRGWVMGGSGLELRTAELARIGRVLRDNGRWSGEQLVSAGWVGRMHADWVAAGAGSPFESYGIAAWAGPGRCWRLDGRYGQYVIVDAQADAVVTITAHEESRDHLLAEIAAEALRDLITPC